MRIIKSVCLETSFVTSINFDGCAATAYGRKQVIDNILEFISNHSSIQRIIVINGSIRQSLAVDYLHAQQNFAFNNNQLVSSFELAHEFMTQLRHALSIHDVITEPPTVELDLFMMSDILNGCEIGTTYKAMTKFYNKLKNGEVLNEFIIETPRAYLDLLGNSNSWRLTNSFEWSDLSHLSIILVQMHHIVKKYARDLTHKIYFCIYDNHNDILELLHDNLNTFQLVPENLIVDFAFSVEEAFVMPFDPIYGTVDRVSDYHDLLMYLTKHVLNPELSYEFANMLSAVYLSYIIYKRVIATCASRLHISTRNLITATPDSSYEEVDKKIDEDTDEEVDGYTCDQDYNIVAVIHRPVPYRCHPYSDGFANKALLFHKDSTLAQDALPVKFKFNELTSCFKKF